MSHIKGPRGRQAGLEMCLCPIQVSLVPVKCAQVVVHQSHALDVAQLLAKVKTPLEE